MKLHVIFHIDDPEEVDEIEEMIKDGLYELGDGGFWETECQERGIESFCSVDREFIVEE